MYNIHIYRVQNITHFFYFRTNKTGIYIRYEVHDYTDSVVCDYVILILLLLFLYQCVLRCAFCFG